MAADCGRHRPGLLWGLGLASLQRTLVQTTAVYRHVVFLDLGKIADYGAGRSGANGAQPFFIEDGRSSVNFVIFTDELSAHLYFTWTLTSMRAMELHQSCSRQRQL